MAELRNRMKILLLAWFMTDEPLILEHDLQKAGTLESMHYDTEMEWMLPVLDKIEAQGCIIEMWMALGRGCKIKPVRHTGVMFNAESMSLVQAVFNCCVEYIEWYNLQKK